jgi:methyl-accepting chemotaxis protein
MEIILLVVSVAFLVIAGYAVPLLIQIRKTATSAAETLDSINQRLPVIIKNLEEITTNMNRVTNTVERQVDDLAMTLGKINGIINFYLEKEEFFRQEVGIPVEKAFRTSSAFIKGIRAFFDSLKTGSSSADSSRSV